VTSLRVFEPLEAFAAEQHRLLASFAAHPSAGRGADKAEQRATWLWLFGHAGHRPEVPARVLRVDGAVLLSPLTIDAPDGQSGTPVTGPDTTTSIGTAARPDAGSDGSPEPGSVPPRCHGLVRAWELPVAWLAVVRPEDVTASGGAGRYVLPMSQARSRAARTLRTLRGGLGDVDVTLDVEGLARWLEHFHPRAWVELDARPVAALVGDQDGAEDVRLGLECLTVGDASGVAAAYQRLRRRSRTLQDLSHSS
jgi:hypothetical protein